MITDKIVNLNSIEVKRVIQNIFWNKSEDNVKPPISDIKFDNKDGMLYIKNKKFFCYSRHHHYPNPKDHYIAIYYFLKSADDLITTIEKL